MLGFELAVVSFPGLLLDWDGVGWALLFVPALLAVLGGWAALRHRAGLLDAGGWLTARPLAGARPGLVPLDAGRLRVRLLAESAAWIVAVTAWVVLGAQDGLVIFGTGLASVAFGVVQAFAARARVARADRARGADHLVARRPGLGTPELTLAG